jgi:hypothetical protein
MISTRLLTFVALFGVSSIAAAQSETWDDLHLAKISEVTLLPNSLEGKWKTSDGFRIDDLSNTKGRSAAERDIIDALNQSGAKGLKSVGDFTLVANGFPINTVTVRVFIFEEPAQCKAWWQKKYEGDDWEKQYQKLDYPNVVSVRSLQSPKIALAFGRVAITSHQIQKGDIHIEAANVVLEQLTNKKRTLKQAAE